MRKAEECHGIAPPMQLSAGEDPHRRWPPLHRFAQPKFFQEIEGRIIGLTNEVIEALERDAIEVEVARHATRFWSRLDEVDLVTILRRTVRSGEAHCTGSNNNDFSHPWRSLESGDDLLRRSTRQMLNDVLCG